MICQHQDFIVNLILSENGLKIDRPVIWLLMIMVLRPEHYQGSQYA
jgi:hypothetical protein